ncbi:hypothetical protein AB7M17_005144 [Bradyrhizobium sp. USDA 377]
MSYTSPSSSAVLPTVERERSALDAGQWWKPVVGFVLLFVAVWLSLYTAYILLPFMRPGSVVIADAKFDTLVRGHMFDSEHRYRVMVFGHSKALTSVRPRELDAAMGAEFRSYNLGLPGEEQFLPILEAALEAGNVPTHVFLTLPWDKKLDKPGLMEFLRNDLEIAKSVMPFRTFPRDAVMFLFMNRNRLAEAVHDVGEQHDNMLEERGYYFIKSQSHYANDRLPDDYALPSDRPNRIDQRKFPEKSYVRSRLDQLATKYGFEVVFIPVPHRIGEFAPAPAADNARLTTLSDHPRIRIMGPDYYNYPPALFADPVHMNLQGALAYTADLARLLKSTGVVD